MASAIVCVRSLKEKRLQLSTEIGTHYRLYSMAGPQHSLSPGSKVNCLNHRVIKCASGVGMHVDMNA